MRAGPEDEEPRRDRDEDVPPDVTVRLLRAVDLLDLGIEARNCHLEPLDPPAEIVADGDARLVVHFPPQHVAEQAFQTTVFLLPEDGAVDTGTEPLPGAAQHRAAQASRVVFDLPEGTRVPFSVEGVLAAMAALSVRVPREATPAPGPAGPPEPTGSDPVRPAEDETAIEAPYRLTVSPSALAAFVHPVAPAGPAADGPLRRRVELWRSRLGVRAEDGAEPDPAQRIVRAVWSRDLDHAKGADIWGPTSLDPKDRRALVTQTYGGRAEPAATPLVVRDLALSSLGAWIDWSGSWEDPSLMIADYHHVAVMGRDAYVRVAYPGFLFPFGHRCLLVKVSERRVGRRGDPVAHLWQRQFIILKQLTRTYDDRDNPWTRVTLAPRVTPDLDDPGAERPFVPRRGGAPYDFALTTTDRSGATRSFTAPLVFVNAQRRRGRVVIQNAAEASLKYQGTNGPFGPINQIRGRGQQVAMAAPVQAGDTSVEAIHLVFDGDLDAVNVTSRPHLTGMRGVLPAMRHLAPQAPAVDLKYATPYLLHGLPTRPPGSPAVGNAGNVGEVVLALTSAAAAVDFSKGSDRSGGFVAPNVQVRGLSRSLGAVGDDGTGQLANGAFDPATLLQGALPKLFGLFSLLELLGDGQGLDRVPAFVTEALDDVGKILAECRRLRTAFDAAQVRMADEVAAAAHEGARAVARAAADELGAHAGLPGLVQTVVDAGTALPRNAGGITTFVDALNALEPELRSLPGVLGRPGFPAAVRSSLGMPVTALQSLVSVKDRLSDLEEIVRGLTGSGAAVTARLHWQPVIKAWDLSNSVPEVFKPHNPETALTIEVEVRASASAPPVTDILAELRDFELNLIGNSESALMRMNFRRIGFHAGSTGKPEVDVVFGGIEFLGPLAFVDTLRSLIPFDGFSDPPFVEISPAGVTAGFDLALPNVAIGVFSLENISLGADARVPFLGDAVTVGFHFCTKEAPFRLTVMCVGGGGWVGMRASPKGLVLLEIGLEACACLSVDFGVASGSVSIAVGVYLRLEGDKGSLTAYFRIRGEVDVLGLISASITLELSLKYEFDTGKLVGRASLVVEVEILFFSASVEISVERRLAGSKGDPTMRQVMPPEPDGTNPAWAEYCNAFAAVPQP